MNNQDNNNNKNEKLEEEFFTNLFEKKEKEQNEQLYKNEFYVLEEEMKTNKDKNSLQFMHDALLNKLMLEDYSPFPPKNDEPENINDKKKEDEKEKELIKEENEFLRSLHRINYLTFSPFSLSFFDDNFKDNSNMGEEYYKEREEKILNMINFDYNKFEVTNDLLLNICQGFIDINKLKEENLEVNRAQDLQSSNSVFSTTNINSTNATTNYKPDISTTAIRERDEPEKDEDELSEEDFYENINKKRKIDFFKDLIKKYDDETSKMTRSEKRENIKKWKDLLDDKEKEYTEHQKKVKEEEKKKKEEEKKNKEIEKKKELERKEKMKKEEELKKGLEEIMKKAKKKIEISQPTNSPPKFRRKQKSKLNHSVKKTLNNSLLSYRNGESTSSFISKKNNLSKSNFNLNKSNLNKSVVNRRKRRFSSTKKK
jgi:hypothetical protein